MCDFSPLFLTLRICTILICVPAYHAMPWTYWSPSTSPTREDNVEITTAVLQGVSLYFRCMINCFKNNMNMELKENFSCTGTQEMRVVHSMVEKANPTDDQLTNALQCLQKGCRLQMHPPLCEMVRNLSNKESNKSIVTETITIVPECSGGQAEPPDPDGKGSDSKFLSDAAQEQQPQPPSPSENIAPSKFQSNQKQPQQNEKDTAPRFLSDINQETKLSSSQNGKDDDSKFISDAAPYSKNIKQGDEYDFDYYYASDRMKPSQTNNNSRLPSNARSNDKPAYLSASTSSTRKTEKRSIRDEDAQFLSDFTAEPSFVQRKKTRNGQEVPSEIDEKDYFYYYGSQAKKKAPEGQDDSEDKFLSDGDKISRRNDFSQIYKHDTTKKYKFTESTQKKKFTPSMIPEMNTITTEKTKQKLKFPNKEIASKYSKNEASISKEVSPRTLPMTSKKYTTVTLPTASTNNQNTEPLTTPLPVQQQKEIGNDSIENINVTTIKPDSIPDSTSFLSDKTSNNSLMDGIKNYDKSTTITVTQTVGLKNMNTENLAQTILETVTTTTDLVYNQTDITVLDENNLTTAQSQENIKSNPPIQDSTTTATTSPKDNGDKMANSNPLTNTEVTNEIQNPKSSSFSKHINSTSSQTANITSTTEYNVHDERTTLQVENERTTLQMENGRKTLQMENETTISPSSTYFQTEKQTALLTEQSHASGMTSKYYRSMTTTTEDAPEVRTMASSEETMKYDDQKNTSILPLVKPLKTEDESTTFSLIMGAVTTNAPLLTDSNTQKNVEPAMKEKIWTPSGVSNSTEMKPSDANDTASTFLSDPIPPHQEKNYTMEYLSTASGDEKYTILRFSPDSFEKTENPPDLKSTRDSTAPTQFTEIEGKKISRSRKFSPDSTEATQFAETKLAGKSSPDSTATTLSTVTEKQLARKFSLDSTESTLFTVTENPTDLNFSPDSTESTQWTQTENKTNQKFLSDSTAQTKLEEIEGKKASNAGKISPNSTNPTQFTKTENLLTGKSSPDSTSPTLLINTENPLAGKFSPDSTESKEFTMTENLTALNFSPDSTESTQWTQTENITDQKFLSDSTAQTELTEIEGKKASHAGKFSPNSTDPTQFTKTENLLTGTSSPDSTFSSLFITTENPLDGKSSPESTESTEFTMTENLTALNFSPDSAESTKYTKTKNLAALKFSSDSTAPTQFTETESKTTSQAGKFSPGSTGPIQFIETDKTNNSTQITETDVEKTSQAGESSADPTASKLSTATEKPLGGMFSLDSTEYTELTVTENPTALNFSPDSAELTQWTNTDNVAALKFSSDSTALTQFTETESKTTSMAGKSSSDPTAPTLSITENPLAGKFSPGSTESTEFTVTEKPTALNFSPNSAESTEWTKMENLADLKFSSDSTAPTQFTETESKTTSLAEKFSPNSTRPTQFIEIETNNPPSLKFSTDSTTSTQFTKLTPEGKFSPDSTAPRQIRETEYTQAETFSPDLNTPTQFTETDGKKALQTGKSSSDPTASTLSITENPLAGKFSSGSTESTEFTVTENPTASNFSPNSAESTEWTKMENLADLKFSSDSTAPTQFTETESKTASQARKFSPVSTELTQFIETDKTKNPTPKFLSESTTPTQFTKTENTSEGKLSPDMTAPGQIKKTEYTQAGTLSPDSTAPTQFTETEGKETSQAEKFSSDPTAPTLSTVTDTSTENPKALTFSSNSNENTHFTEAENYKALKFSPYPTAFDQITETENSKGIKYSSDSTEFTEKENSNPSKSSSYSTDATQFIGTGNSRSLNFSPDSMVSTQMIKTENPAALKLSTDSTEQLQVTETENLQSQIFTLYVTASPTEKAADTDSKYSSNEVLSVTQSEKNYDEVQKFPLNQAYSPNFIDVTSSSVNMQITTTSEPLSGNMSPTESENSEILLTTETELPTESIEFGVTKNILEKNRESDSGASGTTVNENNYPTLTTHYDGRTKVLNENGSAEISYMSRTLFSTAYSNSESEAEKEYLNTLLLLDEESDVTTVNNLNHDEEQRTDDSRVSTKENELTENSSNKFLLSDQFIKENNSYGQSNPENEELQANDESNIFKEYENKINTTKESTVTPKVANSSFVTRNMTNDIKKATYSPPISMEDTTASIDDNESTEEAYPFEDFNNQMQQRNNFVTETDRKGTTSSRLLQSSTSYIVYTPDDEIKTPDENEINSSVPLSRRPFSSFISGSNSMANTEEPTQTTIYNPNSSTINTPNNGQPKITDYVPVNELHNEIAQNDNTTSEKQMPEYIEETQNEDNIKTESSSTTMQSNYSTSIMDNNLKQTESTDLTTTDNSVFTEAKNSKTVQNNDSILIDENSFISTENANSKFIRDAPPEYFDNKIPIQQSYQVEKQTTINDNSINYASNHITTFDISSATTTTEKNEDIYNTYDNIAKENTKNSENTAMDINNGTIEREVIDTTTVENVEAINTNDVEMTSKPLMQDNYRFEVSSKGMENITKKTPGDTSVTNYSSSESERNFEENIGNDEEITVANSIEQIDATPKPYVEFYSRIKTTENDITGTDELTTMLTEDRKDLRDDKTSKQMDLTTDNTASQKNSRNEKGTGINDKDIRYASTINSDIFKTSEKLIMGNMEKTTINIAGTTADTITTKSHISEAPVSDTTATYNVASNKENNLMENTNKNGETTTTNNQKETTATFSGIGSESSTEISTKEDGTEIMYSTEESYGEAKYEDKRNLSDGRKTDGLFMATNQIEGIKPTISTMEFDQNKESESYIDALSTIATNSLIIDGTERVAGVESGKIDKLDYPEIFTFPEVVSTITKLKNTIFINEIAGTEISTSSEIEEQHYFDEQKIADPMNSFTSDLMENTNENETDDVKTMTVIMLSPTTTTKYQSDTTENEIHFQTDSAKEKSTLNSTESRRQNRNFEITVGLSDQSLINPNNIFTETEDSNFQKTQPAENSADMSENEQKTKASYTKYFSTTDYNNLSNLESEALALAADAGKNSEKNKKNIRDEIISNTLNGQQFPTAGSANSQENVGDVISTNDIYIASETNTNTSPNMLHITKNTNIDDDTASNSLDTDTLKAIADTPTSTEFVASYSDIAPSSIITKANFNTKSSNKNIGSDSQLFETETITPVNKDESEKIFEESLQKFENLSWSTTQSWISPNLGNEIDNITEAMTTSKVAPIREETMATIADTIATPAKAVTAEGTAATVATSAETLITTTPAIKAQALETTAVVITETTEEKIAETTKEENVATTVEEAAITEETKDTTLPVTAEAMATASEVAATVAEGVAVTTAEEVAVATAERVAVTTAEGIATTTTQVIEATSEGTAVTSAEEATPEAIAAATSEATDTTTIPVTAEAIATGAKEVVASTTKGGATTTTEVISEGLAVTTRETATTSEAIYTKIMAATTEAITSGTKEVVATTTELMVAKSEGVAATTTKAIYTTIIPEITEAVATGTKGVTVSTAEVMVATSEGIASIDAEETAAATTERIAATTTGGIVTISEGIPVATTEGEAVTTAGVMEEIAATTEGIASTAAEETATTTEGIASTAAEETAATTMEGIASTAAEETAATTEGIASTAAEETAATNTEGIKTVSEGIPAATTEGKAVTTAEVMVTTPEGIAATFAERVAAIISEATDTTTIPVTTEAMETGAKRVAATTSKGEAVTTAKVMVATSEGIVATAAEETAAATTEGIAATTTEDIVTVSEGKTVATIEGEAMITMVATSEGIAATTTEDILTVSEGKTVATTEGEAVTTVVATPEGIAAATAEETAVATTEGIAETTTEDIVTVSEGITVATTEEEAVTTVVATSEVKTVTTVVATSEGIAATSAEGITVTATEEVPEATTEEKAATTTEGIIKPSEGIATTLKEIAATTASTTAKRTASTTAKRTASTTAEEIAATTVIAATTAEGMTAPTKEKIATATTEEKIAAITTEEIDTSTMAVTREEIAETNGEVTANAEVITTVEALAPMAEVTYLEEQSKFPGDKLYTRNLLGNPLFNERLPEVQVRTTETTVSNDLSTTSKKQQSIDKETVEPLKYEPITITKKDNTSSERSANTGESFTTYHNADTQTRSNFEISTTKKDTSYLQNNSEELSNKDFNYVMASNTDIPLTFTEINNKDFTYSFHSKKKDVDQQLTTKAERNFRNEKPRKKERIETGNDIETTENQGSDNWETINDKNTKETSSSDPSKDSNAYSKSETNYINTEAQSDMTETTVGSIEKNSVSESSVTKTMLLITSTEANTGPSKKDIISINQIDESTLISPTTEKYMQQTSEFMNKSLTTESLALTKASETSLQDNDGIFLTTPSAIAITETITEEKYFTLPGQRSSDEPISLERYNIKNSIENRVNEANLIATTMTQNVENNPISTEENIYRLKRIATKSEYVPTTTETSSRSIEQKDDVSTTLEKNKNTQGNIQQISSMTELTDYSTENTSVTSQTKISFTTAGVVSSQENNDQYNSTPKEKTDIEDLTTMQTVPQQNIEEHHLIEAQDVSKKSEVTVIDQTTQIMTTETRLTTIDDTPMILSSELGMKGKVISKETAESTATESILSTQSSGKSLFESNNIDGNTESNTTIKTESEASKEETQFKQQLQKSTAPTKPYTTTTEKSKNIEDMPTTNVVNLLKTLLTTASPPALSTSSSMAESQKAPEKVTSETPAVIKDYGDYHILLKDPDFKLYREKLSEEITDFFDYMQKSGKDFFGEEFFDLLVEVIYGANKPEALLKYNIDENLSQENEAGTAKESVLLDSKDQNKPIEISSEASPAEKNDKITARPKPSNIKDLEDYYLNAIIDEIGKSSFPSLTYDDIKQIEDVLQNGYR